MEDKVILTGGTSTVTFSAKGVLTRWSHDSGPGHLEVLAQPVGQAGAEPMAIRIDAGEPGTVAGLTQYRHTDVIQGTADGRAYVRGDATLESLVNAADVELFAPQPTGTRTLQIETTIDGETTRTMRVVATGTTTVEQLLDSIAGAPGR
jgi:hypothetical protein